jgi:hypothetical protein
MSETAVTIRGKPCSTHEVINRMVDAGFDKESIRKICLALEISNFSHTWEYAAKKREMRKLNHPGQYGYKELAK